jgi:hypothetical protein
MTALASARRQIQQLGPYQSLVLMLLPILLVEPLKIVALFVAGNGHWLTGTGMMMAAYAVSLVFVERLFKVVKSKLMTMNWFAHIWTWYTAVRDTAWRRLRSLTGKMASAFSALNRISIRLLPVPLRGNRP